MNFNSNLNTSNSKNSTGSQESSVLHKIQAEFKATLYNSMYVVLKEEPFSLFYITAIYIIYFFQLLYIPFHPSVIIVFPFKYYFYKNRFKQYGILIVLVIMLAFLFLIVNYTRLCK